MNINISLFILYCFSFFLPLLISIFFSPFLIKFGKKYKFVDKPDYRKKIKKNPPTRIGGLAISLGTFISLCAVSLYLYKFSDLNLFSNYFIASQNIFTICLLAFFFFLIGLSDDILSLSPWPRLFMQIFGASLAYLNGIQIKNLDFSFLPFISSSFDLNSTLSIVLTLIWIVGVTNAFNWIDGLDGLAAGIAALNSIAFVFFSLNGNFLWLNFLFLALCGGCIGFLKFNRYPSKIIMGDGGSYFVGFIFASFGLLSSSNNFGNYEGINNLKTNIFVPLIILAIPLFDMARVIILRISKGLSPLYPDRSHLHHLIKDQGFNDRKTVIIMYILNSMFCILSLKIFNY